MLAGVDEAGRGPLAGPVMAAAVVLPRKHSIQGITDSKKLTERKRKILAAEIKLQAIDWHIAEATVDEIDALNILQASLLAMRRSVLGLSVKPTDVLVDGNQIPDLPYPVEAIVKGDQKIEEIAAASILAKVARDELLIKIAEAYPDYGFEKHKGYGTAMHLQALSKFGPTSWHRKSFAPVAKYLEVAVI